MTYNLPFLRTILQSTLLFLIDGFTFILFLFTVSGLLFTVTTVNRKLATLNYLYLYVILPFVKSYGDISTFTLSPGKIFISVSYTHLRAHETDSYLVCRLL